MHGVSFSSFRSFDIFPLMIAEYTERAYTKMVVMYWIWTFLVFSTRLFYHTTFRLLSRCSEDCCCCGKCIMYTGGNNTFLGKSQSDVEQR